MSPVVVTQVHTEGHRKSGFSAVKPDFEASNDKENEHSHMIGNEQGLGHSTGNGKPHKALAGSNQFAGMNTDGKPASPMEMTPAQKAEAALDAQRKAPELSPNPQFIAENTPQLSNAPTGAPTATRTV